MRVVASVVQVVELQLVVHVEEDADALEPTLVAGAAAFERCEHLSRVYGVYAALGCGVWEYRRVVGDGCGELR